MRRVLAGAAVAVAMGAATSAMADDPVVMRVSHQLPPAHHLAQITEVWAEELEKRSGGKIDVQIFGSNELFGARENYPAVARGQVEAAMSVSVQWGRTIPELNALWIPFQYTTADSVRSFLTSDARTMMDDLLRDKQVEPLAWLYQTRLTIVTSKDKPIVQVEDFDGLKLRGLNDIVDAGYNAAGAGTVAMSGSEVYQALQTGVIDAGLTGVSAGLRRKYYEVQNYATVFPSAAVFFNLYANPEWYDGLPDELKQAIRETSIAIEPQAIDISEEKIREAQIGLVDRGMTVTVLGSRQIDEWKSIMIEPVREAYLEASGDSGRQLLDLLDQL